MTETPITIPPSELSKLSRALPFWLSLGLLPLVWISAIYGSWTLVLVPAVTWYLFTALDGALPWDVPLPLGLAILIWARTHFISKQAEIRTFKHPNTLVTDGPFRYSRNPMYLGFALLLLAGAFFVNTWCALLVPFVFLGATIFWYIPHEERMLRSAFGSDYNAYAWKTRR